MAQDLLLIIGITMLCMLSPGPDMALVMHSTLTGDRRQGLATSLGVLTGNLVHIGYCALGVGYVIAHSVVAYSLLKFGGALYLIVLGLAGLRSAARAQSAPAQVTGEAASAAGSPSLLHGVARSASLLRGLARSAYVRGLLNNLLNPKGALFYLGVFSQVIHPDTPGAHAALLVLAMLSTSALFWFVFVATLQRPVVRAVIARSRRLVDALFGALLVALGLRVATQD